MKSLIGFPLCIALAAACISCGGKPHAHINDVTIKRGDDPKFRVTLVDGKAPVRQSSPFMDLTPLVIIEPGHHTLTVQKGLSDPPDTKVYNLDIVAAAKATYDLVYENGSPSLVLSK